MRLSANSRLMAAFMVVGLVLGAPAAAQQQRRGDIDGDGQVTLADARLLSEYLATRRLPDGREIFPQGDVNGDGRVSAVDVAIIQRYAAGRDVSRFPVGQPGDLPDGVLARVECRGNVAERRISCGERGTAPGGASTDILYGGQNLYVKLASSINGLIDAPAGQQDTLSFDVTVQNLIPQAIGTTDGTTVDPSGVKVFFHAAPTVTGGTGSVEVGENDGLGTFTGADQPYYEYEQILQPGDISSPRTWKIAFDPTVSSFSFLVFVSSPVEFQDGWIEIYPPAATRKNPSVLPTDTILPNQTLQLTDSIRRPFGMVQSGQPITWSHTANGHATVDPSTGLVTAGITPGVDSVTVATTSGISRSGMVQIVVEAASADSTRIDAVPASLSAGDSATITVQARSGRGLDYPISGGAVLLAASAGTLTAVTDNGDGTYSATLTHTGTGIVAVGGTLAGNPIGDSAHVTFGAGAGVSMVKSAGDGQTVTAGSAVATPPAVTVTDAHGNPVSGLGVTFAVASGGGSVTGASAVTNAAGVATVGSWTLGATAGANTLDASATGLSTVTFGATGNAGAPASMVKSAGDGQTATVGTTVAIAPAVTITDANGNPVSGVSVTFVPSGNGGVTGTPAMTDASGVAAVGSWTLATISGANALEASAPGVTAVNFAATGTAGAPANMTKEVGGEGQSAVVNTNVTVAPAVIITDAFGNRVPGASVTFTPSAGGSVTGGSATTSATGRAAVGSWKLRTAVGANTLSVTLGGLSDTFTATGTPDVPANITRTSTHPQNGAVGAAVGSAPTVTVTDQYGNPTPGITVNFAVVAGGGSTTAASPVTNGVGSASIGSWTPGSTLPGPNQLSATAAGGSNPSTSFIVYVPPVVGGDSTQVMGNTTVGSPVTPDVDANDVGLNGEPIAITTTGTLSTVRGGTLTLAANGTFSYLPPAGNVLRDSVGYTIGDSHLSSSGFIKLRFVGRVWYVDNSFGGAATGRDVSPFASISAAQAVAAANDSILVRTGSGVTAGGTLKNGQLLRGQGHSAAFTTTLNGQAVTLLSTGTAPRVGNLVLGSNNTLRGVRVETTSGTALDGPVIGTLSVTEGSIGASNGAAFSLASGSVAMTLDSLRSTNSTLGGVSASSVTGNITINGGINSSITGVGGAAVSISNAPASVLNFSFPGTISKTNGANNGIQISGAGTIQFTGPSIVLNTGNGTGINILNSPATISFADSVKVNTTTGHGIMVSNSSLQGSLSIAGTHNSIASGTGTALSVTNMSIAAGGLNFRSVSANGGANGIVLNNTGSNGLTVQSTGAGTCNTISSPSCTGGIIQNTSGTGIQLTSANNVALNRVLVRDAGVHGIAMNGGSNLTLASSLLQSNGDGDNEHGMSLLNAGGALLITGSLFYGASEDLLNIDNTNTNLTVNVGSSSRFEFPNPRETTFANSGVLVTPKGSSAITVNISGTRFHNIKTNSLNFGGNATATGVHHVTFSGNRVSVDPALNVSCAVSVECRVGGVTVASIGTDSVNFVAVRDTLDRVSGSGAIEVGAGGSSRMVARVDSSEISRSLGDGIAIGNNQRSRMVIQMVRNNLSNIGGDGFQVASGDTDPSIGAGVEGDLDIVLLNNTVATHTTNPAIQFVGGFGVFNFGDVDQVVCLALQGNTVTGTPSGFFDVYLQGNQGGFAGASQGFIRYEDPTGGNLVESDILADNPGTTLANLFTDRGIKSGGATCKRPGI